MRAVKSVGLINGESAITRSKHILEVLTDVRTERLRQQSKFGENCEEFHIPRDRGISVLAEEVGEVAKALLEGDRKNYYEECIQVAAVAAAMAEAAKRAGWAD